MLGLAIRGRREPARKERDMAEWRRKPWGRRVGLALVGTVLGGSGLVAIEAGVRAGDDDPAAASLLRVAAAHGDGDGRCGGEPCDAVARGFVHFFDRRLRDMGGKRRSGHRWPTETGQFPL